MSKNLMLGRKLCFTFALALLMIISAPVFVQSGLAVNQQNIANLTNSERSKAGKAMLSWNGALASSANAKASHMCKYDYWAHTAPDGTTPWSFISAAGYNYVAVAENLAMGFNNDSAVVSGWMASPGHKANILNNAFHDIGVASKSCSINGKSTTLVVAHYGSTGKTTVAAAPKPKAIPTKTTSPTKNSTPVSNPTSNVNKTTPKLTKPATRKVANQPKADKIVDKEQMPEKADLLTLLLQLIQQRQARLLLKS